mmetsp:Transcript_3858/g.24478  ORF Transcript_3858/g.24478 Transcript_3858/m.24478 type:complete len:386 (+) Transcript_3858:5603-6760(+)
MQQHPIDGCVCVQAARRHGLEGHGRNLVWEACVTDLVVGVSQLPPPLLRVVLHRERVARCCDVRVRRHRLQQLSHARLAFHAQLKRFAISRRRRLLRRASRLLRRRRATLGSAGTRRHRLAKRRVVHVHVARARGSEWTDAARRSSGTSKAHACGRRRKRACRLRSGGADAWWPRTSARARPCRRRWRSCAREARIAWACATSETRGRRAWCASATCCCCGRATWTWRWNACDAGWRTAPTTCACFARVPRTRTPPPRGPPSTRTPTKPSVDACTRGATRSTTRRCPKRAWTSSTGRWTCAPRPCARRNPSIFRCTSCTAHRKSRWTFPSARGSAPCAAPSVGSPRKTRSRTWKARTWSCRRTCRKEARPTWTWTWTCPRRRPSL